MMLFQHARAPARLDENGEIVLLEDQDRSLWRSGPIEEAKVLIEKAERHQRPGSYQLQAAIAYEHAVAKNAAETDWQAIAGYYQVLESIHPNPVIRLNRAVAVEKVEGAEAALQLVETVAEPLSGYFYLHGVRGALLSKLGKERDARRAFEKAISLASTPAEAAHIRKQLDRLQLI